MDTNDDVRMEENINEGNEAELNNVENEENGAKKNAQTTPSDDCQASATVDNIMKTLEVQ